MEAHRNGHGRARPETACAVNNIYLNGVRIAAALPDGQARYYLTDQVDSVKVVTDDRGLVLTSHEYLPFGESWITEGDDKNAPKYNSQELDKESGYYFYNARHYDPEIARFVTPDSVIDGEGDTQGWNRYSYCKNNPIEYKDPTGHSTVGRPVKLPSQYLNEKFPDSTVAKVVGVVADAFATSLPGPAIIGVTPTPTPAGGSGSLKNLLSGAKEGAKILFDKAKGLFSKGADDGLKNLPKIKVNKGVIDAFEGKPDVEFLPEGNVVHRRWGGSSKETGSPWYSEKNYSKPGNAKRYLSLPEGNTAQNSTAFRVNEGTYVLKGKAASQVGTPGFGDYATGKGIQLYFPDISKLTPIK